MLIARRGENEKIDGEKAKHAQSFSQACQV